MKNKTKIIAEYFQWRIRKVANEAKRRGLNTIDRALLNLERDRLIDELLSLPNHWVQLLQDYRNDYFDRLRLGLTGQYVHVNTLNLSHENQVKLYMQARNSGQRLIKDVFETNK